MIPPAEEGPAIAGRRPMVISASRRTDIPAFYMPWFMECIRDGAFEVENPYNHRVHRVPAAAGEVHTIVFWSKNYAPFLEGGYGERLRGMGYHLYFHCTLNSAQPQLEPNVPPIGRRLDDLGALSARFGPESVNWRFDPICHFRRAGGEIQDNLADFPRIADAAARAGLRGCTVSFMDHYAKIERRLRRVPDLTFAEIGPEAKRRILLRLEAELAARGMRLYTCCERELLEGLEAGASVKAGACIPSEHLMDLYGGRLSTRRDAGQRRGAGCECRVSVDIGSYRRQPCGHGCLFCYANPGCGSRAA
jgi:hypothetical protein